MSTPREAAGGSPAHASLLGVFNEHPFPGEVKSRWVLPPGGYSGFTISRGETLRIVDLEGQQVADLVCFSLVDPSEEMNLANSLHLNDKLEFVEGDRLYSVDCSPMMRIAGYSNERSFAYGSMCSEELNRARFGVANSPNCRHSLELALSPWGIDRRRIPNAFVPFMNFVVNADGSVESREPTSVAGDFYDLTAEMDLIVGISNCPQAFNAVNAHNPTCLGLAVYQGREAADQRS